jgi:hypothetical protein
MGAKGSSKYISLLFLKALSNEARLEIFRGAVSFLFHFVQPFLWDWLLPWV